MGGRVGLATGRAQAVVRASLPKLASLLTLGGRGATVGQLGEVETTAALYITEAAPGEERLYLALFEEPRLVAPNCRAAWCRAVRRRAVLCRT